MEEIKCHVGDCLTVTLTLNPSFVRAGSVKGKGLRFFSGVYPERDSSVASLTQNDN